jgi:hypothetical protein
VYEDESLEPIGTSRRIVDKIDELGLQPFDPPDPLPPIQEDEEGVIEGFAHYTGIAQHRGLMYRAH